MEQRKKNLAITYEGLSTGNFNDIAYGEYGFWGCSTPATIAVALLAAGIILMTVKLSRIEKKLDELKKT